MMGVENTSDPEISSDDAPPETVLDSDDRESSETVSPADLTSRRGDDLRLLEAILFAATEPLELQTLRDRLPDRSDVPILLQELQETYASRGINLVRSGNRFAFRTALDLMPRLQVQSVVARKLSRAAVETLAIIAYHQPVTRAEVEEIRGVALSKGTLDILLEANWVKPKGRRKAPGRPVTWVTTDGFLDHFGLAALEDLPGLEELKQAGLLEARPGMTLQDMGDPDLLSFAVEADNASDNEDHDRPDEDLPDEDIIEADVVVDPDSRDEPNA